METIKALTDTAVLQIETYPSLTSKEKVKRLIKSCIPGKASCASGCIFMAERTFGKRAALCLGGCRR